MKTLRDVNLPTSVVNLMPESIARENSIIAISLEGNVLTVACPQESLQRLDEERIRFVLNRPIQWLRFPLAEILDAIQRHYVEDGAIEQCTWSMRYQCPQRWKDLAQTGDDSLRYCAVCAKNVYACLSHDEVVQRAKNGHCVAIMLNGVELIGDVDE